MKKIKIEMIQNFIKANKKKIAIFATVAIGISIGAVVIYKNKVIAEVYGYKLRNKDISKNINMYKKMRQYSNPRPTKQDLEIELENKKEYYINKFKNEMVLKNKALELSLFTEEQLTQEVEKQLELEKNSYGRENYKKILYQNVMTEKQYKEQIESRMVYEAVFNEITKDIKAEESEFIEYYEKNKDNYIIAPGCNLYHVAAKTKEDILAAQRALKEGTPLAELAKKYNEDGTEDRGGLLLRITEEDPETSFYLSPEAEEVVNNLPPKTYSDIVETNYGYHIFLKDNYNITPIFKEYEEVKDMVEGVVIFNKSRDFFNTKVKEWEDNCGIIIK